MLPLKRLLFALCGLAAVLSAQAQSTALINGRVVNAVDGSPIENASAKLDLNPADGLVEKEAQTDPFGFFKLKEITPGNYTFRVEHPHFIAQEESLTLAAGASTNKLIRLNPIDGKVFFDVYFQAWCLSTHARLAGASITAEYWKPDGDLSGGPDQVFKLVAGAAGDATLVGMQDGFYTFKVSQTGWEPLSYKPPANSGFITSGDKVRLIRYHYGSVFLRPIKQDLKVTVKGYDPVTDKPNQLLKGMTIKSTGVDLVNPKLELVPTQTALSAEDGTYTFGNLVPIQWKIGVGRLGYVPKEVLVLPDANGALPAQTVNVDLEPTKVKVVVASPYQTTDAVRGAKVQLEGIRNSNTEGINRQVVATPDPAGNTASAIFDNLLPGRYWIHVLHQTTIGGLPSRSGPLQGPNAFQVSFFPKETYAEVTVGVTEEVRVDLDPVPAKIRGRLWATDELGNVETEVFDPEPNRIFHLMAQKGITFLEHKLIKLLQDTNNSVTVDTDEAGGYTALIIPGIFGVQIPSVTSYSGHNIEFGDLTTGLGPQPGPWPYPDIWPYPVFEFKHHGAGLRFDSAHEYQLDLFLHAHYINLCGSVRTQGAPFGGLVLRMNQDGSDVQTIAYDHLQDTGAEVTASGSTTVTARVKQGNSFLLKHVSPGTYTIALNHPDYDSTPVSVTIAPWTPPGVLPVVSPFTPTYFFPGITHCDPAFNLVADWKTKGSISVSIFTWFPGNPPDDPPRYIPGGENPPRYFRMAGLPDRVFDFVSFAGGIPAPSYTIWLRHGDGWFSSAGSGSATFEAYEGGPMENTPPNNPPSAFTAYTLDLHAYSQSDTNIEVPGVTVFFGPDSSRPAGGQIAHDKSPYPTGATNNLGQWVFGGSETEVIDAATRLVRVKVFMIRAMVVSGKISSTDGPIPGAAVVVRNRYGNPIGQMVTGPDGLYRFGSILPQIVYVDVNRRGFKPQRLRFSPPSPSNPDITGDFNLEDVPAPTIDQFTMNRFGLFLPGVSKSGDLHGFNPEAARDVLTDSWKAGARGADFSLTFDGFMQANETPGPPEKFDVVDRVVEMWLIDRRAFTNAFVNELNQTSTQSVDPPAPFKYLNVQKWLEPIFKGQKDGQPYYVIHQMKRRAEAGPGNQFEGKINLWELPSGVFNPRVIAITESGGVAFKDYDLPAGKESLQGMNLPQWAATILEVIGVGANFGKFTDDIHAHYGDGFLKIGTISPVVEGRIGLSPLTNAPTDDSYVTYKYVLGVELPFGEGTSKTGPLNLGPDLLGFKIQGAKAEFEVKGQEKKASLNIALSLSLPSKVEERDASYLPVVVKELPAIEVDPKLKYTGKFGITQTLNSDWLGQNIVSDFGFFLDAQGTVDIAVRANATPVLRFIPYVGPVLEGLDKTGALTIKGVFETTLGGKFKIEATTHFPKPGTGGTQTRGEEPESWSPIGSSEVKKEIKLILRIAAGLQVSAFRGTAEGTALLQVGAPADAPTVEGILFTIDPLGKGPLITKIEGAFSAVVRVALNLWTVKFSKQMQWDIAKFVVDRHSEPSFELVPINITYTVINAASAPGQSFIGKKGTIIDRFYGAGSFDLAEGSPVLVFTGIDPATGKMTVMASFPSGGGWSAPAQLGSAAGVVSVAAVENPAGGWIVVWSEIAEADVGNPFPSSTIKYSVSDVTGLIWSDPAIVTSSNEAMFDLKLVRAGDRVLLSYLSTSEGPLGDNQSLSSAAWDGARWSPPLQQLPPQPIKTFDLAGNSNTNALAVISTGSGNLVSLFWDGNSWAPPQTIATGAGNAISLKFNPSNEGVLAWENDTDSLAFSKFAAATKTWSNLGVPIPHVLTDDIEMLPLTANGETLFLLAWVEGGDNTSVWYAFLDGQGAVRLDRTEVTLNTAGTFQNLQLRPVEGFRAAIVARYSTPTNIAVREFTVGLPSPNDCDGDGISDDLAITLGSAQDCNGNGIPDDCDIRSGTSQDRNHNGIPDECEAPPPDDCNRDGISDQYQLAAGIGDANENGILDDCEGRAGITILRLPRTGPARYYRAAKVAITSISADFIELQYEGTLEQADTITGPWIRVNAASQGTTRLLPLLKNGSARYYRADKITVLSVLGDFVEVQYEGILEQADSVTGPWTRVPDAGQTLTKTVPSPANVPARFYRASKIGVTSVSSDFIGLQYEGTLEQADAVTGPWSPVP